MKMFAAFFFLCLLISCPFGLDPELMTTVEGWNVDGPVHSERVGATPPLEAGSPLQPGQRQPPFSDHPGRKGLVSLKTDLMQLPPVTFYRLHDHCGVSQMEIPTRRNANLAISHASRQECVQLARCVVLCFCTELILKCWLTAGKCRKPKTHLCG